MPAAMTLPLSSAIVLRRAWLAGCASLECTVWQTCCYRSRMHDGRAHVRIRRAFCQLQTVPSGHAPWSVRRTTVAKSLVHSNSWPVTAIQQAYVRLHIKILFPSHNAHSGLALPLLILSSSTFLLSSSNPLTRSFASSFFFSLTWKR
jgi:hypothetical protein